MADLARPDEAICVRLKLDLTFEPSLLTPIIFQGARYFTGPDDLQYRWRPSTTTVDVVVSSARLRSVKLLANLFL